MTAADQPTTEPSEALRLGRIAWDARAAIISYQSDDPDVVNETLEEIQTDIGRAILDALAPQPAAETEVQARALLDAANAMDADPTFRDPLRLKSDWLRARADRIERGDEA